MQITTELTLSPKQVSQTNGNSVSSHFCFISSRLTDAMMMVCFVDKQRML